MLQDLEAELGMLKRVMSYKHPSAAQIMCGRL